LRTSWSAVVLRVAIVAALVVTAAGFLVTAAGASTFTVTNANASGNGSLTKAIDDANNHPGADTITFASGTNGQTIAEPQSTVEAGGALTIQGNGAGVTKVAGEIDVNSGGASETTTVTITGLTVGDLNINSGFGSTTTATVTNVNVITDGIDINSGFNNSKTTATLTNVHVTGPTGINVNAGESTTTATMTNSSVDGVTGDALEANQSVVHVSGSTFSNSENDGIDNSASTIDVVNSTLSGNKGEEQLFNDGGTTTLQNVTIDNAPSGDAVDNDAGELTFTNTIFADSRSNNCIGNGTFTSHGGNLASDASCHLTGTGDHPSTPAKLGALANNGGATKTQLPLAGSKAIDGGVATGCPKVDQRGVARPQDGDHNGSAVCDVGAVEIAGSATTTTSAAPTTTTTAAPVTVASAGTPVTTAAAAELPRTGASSTRLALGGAATLLLGVALAFTRRRHAPAR